MEESPPVRHARERSTSVTAAVTTFALSGLIVLVVVAVGGAIVLRGTGTSQAIDEAIRLTQVLADGVVEPVLSDGLTSGDPAAISQVDLVVNRVLEGGAGGIVRIKIWRPDGTILYSDVPALIGRRFALADEELDVLRSGEPRSELSDLSKEENRYERHEGSLLEVYLPLHTLGGDPLLLEAYLRFSSVVSGGHRTWAAFGPVFLGGAVLLFILQLPLAWSMARRLNESRRRREELLEAVIEASDAERRRIAGEIHDGVVQDLVGIAYAADVAADRLTESEDRHPVAPQLLEVAEGVRRSIRRLRSQLVEVYPPDLYATGLEAALPDLLAPLQAKGITTRLDAGSDLHLPPEIEELFYRTSQEALRNVLRHAKARSVDVRLRAASGRAVLIVEDDGIGFSVDHAELRRSEGHLGLKLLRDLAAAAGGDLRVEPRPGRGTSLRLEVAVP